MSQGKREKIFETSDNDNILYDADNDNTGSASPSFISYVNASTTGDPSVCILSLRNSELSLAPLDIFEKLNEWPNICVRELFPW